MSHTPLWSWEMSPAVNIEIASWGFLRDKQHVWGSNDCFVAMWIPSSREIYRYLGSECYSFLVPAPLPDPGYGHIRMPLKWGSFSGLSIWCWFSRVEGVSHSLSMATSMTSNLHVTRYAQVFKGNQEQSCLLFFSYCKTKMLSLAQFRTSSHNEIAQGKWRLLQCY